MSPGQCKQVLTQGMDYYDQQDHVASCISPNQAHEQHNQAEKGSEPAKVETANTNCLSTAEIG